MGGAITQQRICSSVSGHRSRAHFTADVSSADPDMKHHLMDSGADLSIRAGGVGAGGCHPYPPKTEEYWHLALAS
jgi:hypothetical protein